MFFYYLLQNYNKVDIDIQFHSSALASSESTLLHRPAPKQRLDYYYEVQ
jgi:hypothetical protein